MAFTFTPASVISSNLAPKTGVLGEAADAGTFVYRDSSDSNKLKKASNAALASADVVGFTLASGASGQPVPYVDTGTITVQAAAFNVVDVPLVLDVSGQCQTVADFILEVAPAYLTILGWITSATTFKLHLVSTGELRQQT